MYGVMQKLLDSFPDAVRPRNCAEWKKPPITPKHRKAIPDFRAVHQGKSTLNIHLAHCLSPILPSHLQNTWMTIVKESIRKCANKDLFTHSLLSSKGR